jgi:DNA-binding FadR family transcriptional regulator
MQAFAFVNPLIGMICNVLHESMRASIDLPKQAPERKRNLAVEFHVETTDAIARG